MSFEKVVTIFAEGEGERERERERESSAEIGWFVVEFTREGL